MYQYARVTGQSMVCIKRKKQRHKKTGNVRTYATFRCVQVNIVAEKNNNYYIF